VVTDFGANEWLVDEIHDQFLRDPASVDPAWRTVFDNRAATTVLRGTAARVAANMDASVRVPTATSARAVPANPLTGNRDLVNEYLAATGRGTVSVTQLIGYAMVRAVMAHPELNRAYADAHGRPAVVAPEHVNLGLAVDVVRPDGTRTLVVPSVKAAELMDFAAFRAACADLVDRARRNALTVADLSGTTISLTNTGGLGTVHSVPRLLPGQGAIVAAGALEYPAEYAGATAKTLAELAIGRTLTLTATYDHRIIQGAAAAGFLRTVHHLLRGDDGFYDDVLAALRIPYPPVRWTRDDPERDRRTGTARVTRLIDAYRSHGHLVADTDPLAGQPRRHPELDPATHGLTLWDLDREFVTDGFGDRPVLTLREILRALRAAYCGTVGFEYMHIQDPARRRWIQARVEHGPDEVSRAQRRHILDRLSAAEAFETFLHVRHNGRRRFSLEGAEAAVVLLDQLIGQAADAGLAEVALGMSHRGRLNILTTVLGKDIVALGPSGDVTYNLGTRSILTTPSGGRISVCLVANPSHLESVDPVLQGFARGRQDAGATVLPILTHGDAAFAGQGVVAETLNLSQVHGYRTGGTIHLVTNNRIGFTTGPRDARSAVYPTGVARMVDAPVFHVNADDPEACVRVARLAFAFRQAFHTDVVIDLTCYRRRGHNENEDPSMTQPVLYRQIDGKRPVRERYADRLVESADVTPAEAEAVLAQHRERAARSFARPAAVADPEPTAPAVAVPTAVGEDVVKRIVEVHVDPPAGLAVHPRVLAQFQRRAQMVADGTIDWAMAETLAVGSLLIDGVPVRLTGEDSRRGTFAQRHHVVVDRDTGREYVPLAHLTPDQARYSCHDSPLSEFAAMGFEYGYSVARPDALVVWEAQFGDFANGAQTVVDEFIAAGERRWGQRSGVTLLLPHGREGQGPNHSSARIERYLQLCAEDNMVVAMPSAPASYFHLLRAQALSPSRRPLVVFTPKSMLRLKAASSRLDEFTRGGFRPVLADTTVTARRVLLCSGKVYWELAARRAEDGVEDVAIVRLERLHPVPSAELVHELGRYPAGAELLWVQEEPANQGAWSFLRDHLPAGVRCISPPASATTAPGAPERFAREQRDVIDRAFSRSLSEWKGAGTPP
jgi:multifunctional 2-oxoglutarate metabolism enzyme